MSRNYSDYYLPNNVITSAINGDITAIDMILDFYENYIEKLSSNTYTDDSGNQHYGTDRTMCDELKSKLIENIMKFKI